MKLPYKPQTFLFDCFVQRHSNPQAISLKEVVNVRIKNKNIINTNFEVINIETNKFLVIKNDKSITSTYIGQTKTMFVK